MPVEGWREGRGHTRFYLFQIGARSQLNDRDPNKKVTITV